VQVVVETQESHKSVVGAAAADLLQLPMMTLVLGSGYDQLLQTKHDSLARESAYHELKQTPSTL
jgi:hypothetical protein